MNFSKYMNYPRIDQLQGAPEVGATYLVPAARRKWPSIGLTKGGSASMRLAASWWPLVGPLHNDAEYFEVHANHYHYDIRFLTDQQLRTFDYHKRHDSMAMAAIQIAHGLLPEWRPLKCRRLQPEYPHADQLMIRRLNRAYEGMQAPCNTRGWVCPHKNFPLSSYVPDAQGVITCPLHGLRIRAADGICAGNDRSPR